MFANIFSLGTNTFFSVFVIHLSNVSISVGKHNNQIAIIYKNDYEREISSYLPILEQNINTTSVQAYGNTFICSVSIPRICDRDSGVLVFSIS